MAKTTIQIVHDKEVQGDVAFQLLTSQLTSKSHLVALQNILSAIDSGARNASVTTAVDDSAGVAASGTLTYSAQATAADTLVINGITLTAVASGATGPQFNVGTNATTQAANVVSAIQAQSALVGVVSASSALGVVTIVSAISGPIGNSITLAKGTDAGSVCTVGGVSNGRLSNGSAATVLSSVTYKFGL